MGKMEENVEWSLDAFKAVNTTEVYFPFSQLHCYPYFPRMPLNHHNRVSNSTRATTTQLRFAHSTLSRLLSHPYGTTTQPIIVQTSSTSLLAPPMIPFFILISTHHPQAVAPTAIVSIRSTTITKSKAAIPLLQILVKSEGATLSKPCHLQVHELRVPEEVS